jgi:ribosomal-protein-alanine N-acetyltransferase
MQENNEILFWVLALQEAPGTMIGNICLWRFQKEHYRAEVGYMLDPAYQKKGYMKEAIEAVIKYGFKGLKLHSLEAMINPLNADSARVLAMTGFKQEGHLTENYYHNGQFTDTIIYSLVNREVDNKL